MCDISTFFPLEEVYISPGLIEFPDTEFSAIGIIRIIFDFFNKLLAIRNKEIAIAAPPISFFIFRIELPGFIFTPPVSKVTPLPMMTIGLSFFEIFLLEICKISGLIVEDWPTAYVKGNFDLISAWL